MKNNPLFLGAVALVVGFGIGRASAPPAPTNSDTTHADNAAIAQAATLAQYSEQTVHELENGGEPYALFFHSESCSTCRRKEALLEADPSLQESLDNVVKIPYESAPTTLLQKYDITKYDQFVLCDGAGNCETHKGIDQDDVADHVTGKTSLNEDDGSMNEISATSEASSETRFVKYPDPAQLVALRDSGTPYTVFFHSKTCATCRRLEEEIASRSKEIPDEHTIFLVDYESSDIEARKALGVTSYHTFVFFDGENFETKAGLSTDEVFAAI